MSGGKKGKSSTSTSSSLQSRVPIPYINDDLKAISNEAAALYEQGLPDFYPNQTYADFTEEQNQALDLTRSRAFNGSPLVDEAQNFATDLASGAYQDNPYLNDMIDLLGRNAIRDVNSSYNQSGRLGSGMNLDTGVRAVTEAQLPFLLDQYNTSIGQRLAASELAPTLAREDYYDLSKLYGVGEARQAQEQLAIDEDMARYEYEAFKPYNNLQRYADFIYTSPAADPGFGNTYSESTQTQKQSGGGSILGSALGAASLAAAPFTGGASLGFGGGFGSLGGVSSLIGAGSFGLGTGGQSGISGFGNAINAARGFYGPGF